MHTALVTGAGHNRTTLPWLRKDFASILTAFSPRSKERPEELAAEGELDLLIATDCISEGQNLQDCDTLINYDSSLAISRLPSQDLYALYQGWLDRVVALEAAEITGVFAPAGSAERSLALRDGLDTHARLRRDIAALRAQATKEKQLNRRVDLNLEIKRLEVQLAATQETLELGVLREEPEADHQENRRIPQQRR